MATAATQVSASGGLVTDAVRALGVEGDGRAPETSYGIWPGTTNDLPNGGFSSGATGWSTVFCDQAVEIIVGPSGAGTVPADKLTVNSAQLACALLSDANTQASAGVRSLSAWVYCPPGSSAIGKFAQLQAYEHGGAQASAIFAQYSHPTSGVSGLQLTAGWHRLTAVGSVAQPDRTFLRFQVNLSGTVPIGAVLYVAWCQCERRSTPTPYAATARSDGRVRLPLANMAASRLWAALRVRPSWPHDAPPSPVVTLWRWGDASGSVELVVDEDDWLVARRSNAVATEEATLRAFFDAGAELTLIVAGTPDALTVSANGQPFRNHDVRTLFDDFERADTVAGLGTPPTSPHGQAWVQQGAGVPKIQSGRYVSDDPSLVYARIDHDTPPTKMQADASFLGAFGPNTAIGLLSANNPTPAGVGTTFATMLHPVVGVGVWLLQVFDAGSDTTIKSGLWPNIPGVTVLDTVPGSSTFGFYTLKTDGTVYRFAVEVDLATSSARLTAFQGATELLDTTVTDPRIATHHGRYTVYQVFRIAGSTPAQDAVARIEAVETWEAVATPATPSPIAPTIASTLADVGSADGATGHLAGEVLWVAHGSGVLTDADAASLAAIADDPSVSDFPSTAKLRLIWPAATEAATAVTDDPDPATIVVRPQRRLDARRHLRPVQPTVWRHLSIIAPVSTDTGSPLTMTAAERAVVDMYVENFPRLVYQFSHGRGVIEQTVHVSATPVTQKSAIGGLWWVSPADAAAIHLEANAAAYDDVCLFVSNTNIPCAFSGLTISGPSPGGHSYIPIRDLIAGPGQNPESTLAVHEFTWHLCRWWIDNGFPCPPDLKAEDYIDPRTGVNYSATGDDFHHFHNDLYQGYIADLVTGNALGGTRAAWAIGTPVS